MKLTDKHLPLALQLHRGHTSSELSSFTAFINLSGENILLAQNKFEELYNSEIEINNESDDQPKDDYWNYEYIKVHEIFPSFYRQSTFIGLYSFLETRLYSLCDNLHRVKGLCNLSGDTRIENSKIYLKNELGIEINTNDLKIFWDTIKDFQKIRNCLVHNNGYLTYLAINKQQTLRVIISKNPYSELSSNRIQITDDKFLLDFIGIIKEYLLALFDKISKEIDFE